MSIANSFEYDVFLSYAHVDDEPVPGREEGWVTTLIKNLQWRVTRLCGRRDVFKLWVDHGLARHFDFSPQILSTLRSSATLMVILSPGYLASDWCRRERESFLTEVGKHVDRHSSVFVVECDRVPLDERPSEFSGLTGYQFWEAREGRFPRTLGHPDPRDDELYWAKLEDLSRHLHQELLRIKRDGAEGAPVSGNGDGPAVFLAEVTDDLDPLRDQVHRYLNQQGVRVLPASWYPRETRMFQEATDRDLSHCSVFVQLLSPIRGKSFPGSSCSCVALQQQRAVLSGKPILQWRDPGLDLETVADPGHRALLEGGTVQAVDLETFKQEIVKSTRKAERRPRRSAGQPFVFVNIDREDLPIAENLYQVLEHHGCAYAIPMQEGRAEIVRKDLEANLLDCDGLVVVYGQIPEAWVREQLRQWRKMLFRREKPLRALAIYEGPPEVKHPLGMKLPEMHVIDCRSGIEVHRLEPFLESVTGEAALMKG